MNYRILASGSSGNAFLFEEYILLDTGISFTNLKKVCDVSKIKYVLLTHKHGDHLNKPTVRKLYAETNAKFICGEWLKDELKLFSDRVVVIELNQLYKLGKVTISAFNLYHDVPNCGYRLVKDGYKHIHATDTFTLDGISAKDYDSATIEANHEPKKALLLIDKAYENGEFTHLVGAINSHLAVQKALDFAISNNIKKVDFVHIGKSTKKEVENEIKKQNNKNYSCF